jgi:heptosyltransferase-2
MCPAIDDIITVDRIDMRDGPPWRAIGRIGKLMADVRRRRFDVALDCHGFRETSLLAWWTRAPQRWGLKRFDQPFLGLCFNRPPVLEDKSVHASQSFVRLVSSFVGLPEKVETLPPLVIPEEALGWAQRTLPRSSPVVLFVDAPVPARLWPLERFAALAEHIVGNLRTPVVMVAQRPQKLERQDVQVLSGLSIPRLAAVVARARLLVSNDTGPMHLGPALRIPTLGIFSVGIPTHFRPTGPLDQYVQGNPIDTIGVDTVAAIVDQIWEATDPQGPRR